LSPAPLRGLKALTGLELYNCHRLTAPLVWMLSSAR